jgi:Mg2+/citrate symporter
MPLLLRLKSSAVRQATKVIGRLALMLALIFMSLEMMRVQGWGLDVVERLASALSLSVTEFWTTIAGMSVAAAFGLLILGLGASALSRSTLLDTEENPEEEIDVQAITQRIRSYELHEAGRGEAHSTSA